MALLGKSDGRDAFIDGGMRACLGLRVASRSFGFEVEVWVEEGREAEIEVVAEIEVEVEAGTEIEVEVEEEAGPDVEAEAGLEADSNEFSNLNVPPIALVG